jgi:hypothetical protein
MADRAIYLEGQKFLIEIEICKQLMADPMLWGYV